MDFEQDNNQLEPIEPAAMGGSEAVKEPARKGSGWRILLGIILALSILVNIALLFMLIGTVALWMDSSS